MNRPDVRVWQTLYAKICVIWKHCESCDECDRAISQRILWYRQFPMPSIGPRASSPMLTGHDEGFEWKTGKANEIDIDDRILTFRLFRRNWDSFSFLLLLLSFVSWAWDDGLLAERCLAVEFEFPLVRWGDRERSFGEWASIALKEKTQLESRSVACFFFLRSRWQPPMDEERGERRRKKKNNYLFSSSSELISYYW